MRESLRSNVMGLMGLCMLVTGLLTANLAVAGVKFEEYKAKYPHAKMERKDGILLVTLHTNGDSLKWNLAVHEEMGFVFKDIANDRENEVVILTGAGDNFTLPDVEAFMALPPTTPERWDTIMLHAKEFMMNMLDIQVPVIGVFNGPSVIHAEIAALGDIVLATDNTEVADQGHFVYGIVPGDGVHVIWPMLLGPNRGRTFLLTGQKLSAQELHELGVVAEVLPKDKIMDRAWELAEMLRKQPRLTRRYSRLVLTQDIKKKMLEHLSLGLALEGITDIRALDEAGSR